MFVCEVTCCSHRAALQETKEEQMQNIWCTFLNRPTTKQHQQLKVIHMRTSYLSQLSPESLCNHLGPSHFVGWKKVRTHPKQLLRKNVEKNTVFPQTFTQICGHIFFLLRFFLNMNKRNMGKISATSIFHWFYSLHIGSYVWSSSEHFPWSQQESFTLKHQINETIYCPNFKVTSRTRWIRGCMFDLIVQFIQLLLKVYLTLLTFLWFPSKFTHYLKWL